MIQDSWCSGLALKFSDEKSWVRLSKNIRVCVPTSYQKKNYLGLCLALPWTGLQLQWSNIARGFQCPFNFVGIS